MKIQKRRASEAARGRCQWDLRHCIQFWKQWDSAIVSWGFLVSCFLPFGLMWTKPENTGTVCALLPGEGFYFCFICKVQLTSVVLVPESHWMICCPIKEICNLAEPCAVLLLWCREGGKWIWVFLWFRGSGLNGSGRCVHVVTASDSVIKATSSAAFGFVSVCEPKSWCWTNAFHRRGVEFLLPGGRAAP